MCISIYLVIINSHTCVQALEVESSVIQWVVQSIIGSLYPGAPASRVLLPLKVLCVLVEVYPYGIETDTPKEVQDCMYLSQVVSVCIGNMNHQREILRSASFDVLCAFPAPLPGLYECKDIDAILRICTRLIKSPRFKECEYGALLLRLIFRKYVSESDSISIDLLSLKSEERGAGERQARILSFLQQMNELILKETSGDYGGTSCSLKDISTWHSTTQGLILCLR
jgi:hypothetical protein